MHLCYRINSTFKEVDDLVDGVMDFLKHICREKDSFRINIINFGLRELLINAVEHGNKFDSEKEIICDFYYNYDGIHIRVVDRGNGFDINEFMTSCDTSDALRERIRGIFILMKLGYRLNTKGSRVDATFRWPH